VAVGAEGAKALRDQSCGNNNTTTTSTSTACPVSQTSTLYTDDSTTVSAIVPYCGKEEKKRSCKRVSDDRKKCRNQKLTLEYSDGNDSDNPGYKEFDVRPFTELNYDQCDGNGNVGEKKKPKKKSAVGAGNNKKFNEESEQANCGYYAAKKSGYPLKRYRNQDAINDDTEVTTFQQEKKKKTVTKKSYKIDY